MLLPEAEEERQHPHGQQRRELPHQIGRTHPAHHVDQLVGEPLDVAAQFDRLDRLQRLLDQRDTLPVPLADRAEDRGLLRADHGSNGQSAGMFGHWFHSPESRLNSSGSLVTWCSSR